MKILIVDDEAPIREWFEFVVSKLDGVDVFSAGTGEEAFELILRERPELVFADIKMPGMDGIRLLEKIRLEKLNMPFVILTNHADFSYARKAVGLDAYSYLLKTEVDAEDIRKIIQSLRGKNKRTADTAARALPELTEIWRHDCSERAEKLAAQLKLPDKQAYYVLAVAEKASEKILPLLEELHEPAAVIASRIVVLVKRRPPLIDLIASFQLSAAFSAKHDGADEICTAISEAFSALDYSFIAGEGKILDYPLLSSAPALDFTLATTLFRKIMSLIELEQTLELETLLRDFFLLFRPVHPEALNWIRSCCHRIYHALEDRCFCESGPELNTQIQPNTNFATLDEAQEKIFNLLNCLNARVNAVDYSAVRKAKQFIKKHYAQNISLAAISQYVCLSPEYFCRLFKKKTGISFGSYLTAFRLEQANKLILDSDLTITEIATRVGYNNPSYFSSLYKKNMGKSPEQARKSKSL